MRITLTRNRKYKLTVTVKEPNSLMPLAMDPTDDVIMHFTEKGKTPVLILSSVLTPVSNPNYDDQDPEQGPEFNDGEWVMLLTECETKLFTSKVGYPEDGSPYLAPIRGQLSIDSAITAIEFADVLIDDIYISDIGLPDCVDV